MPRAMHPSSCVRYLARALTLAAAFGAGALASHFLAATATFAQSGVPVVPCSDPRGCPDLFVDQRKLTQGRIEQRTFSPADCAVQEGATQPGTRLLLRFTSTTPNRGPGDLFVGNPNDHPDWFQFDTCHGHPHFNEYADYRLWTPAAYQAWQSLRAENPGALAADLLAANPGLASQMVAGHKQGFCVIDIVRYKIPGVRTDRQKYTSCSSNQGISVGWADEYVWRLDGQWIDITDVSPGNYVLEDEVNAERFFREANYSNNSAAITVQVPVH